MVIKPDHRTISGRFNVADKMSRFRTHPGCRPLRG